MAMREVDTNKPAKPVSSGPLREVFRFLGSLKLGVVLLLISIGVLVPATIVDSAKGLDYARWLIYKSPWFIAFAMLMALNILMAMLLRFPWKRRHLGFLVCHLGLLILLAGSLMTFRMGIEGNLRLVEGQSADHFEILTDSQLTVTFFDEKSGTKPNLIDFHLPAGPNDLPDGESLDLGEMDEIRVRVLKLYRHAQYDGSEFRPSDLEPGKAEGLEPAALFEVTVAGEPYPMWLQRRNPQLNSRRLRTPKGPMLIRFDCPRQPLEFSLKLLDFERAMNPGGMGDASFSSSVEVIDESVGITQQHEISMNEPLTYGKFTLYQSSWGTIGGREAVSIFTVAYDPGRPLKYAGCLMICVGTFMMFYLRGLLSKKAPPRSPPQTES